MDLALTRGAPLHESDLTGFFERARDLRLAHWSQARTGPNPAAPTRTPVDLTPIPHVVKSPIGAETAENPTRISSRYILHWTGRFHDRNSSGFNGDALPTRRPLYWPANLRSVEWFKPVDSLRRLGFDVPLEEPQADTIRQKIRNREAVLLDRLHFFSHVEVLGR